MKKLYFHSRHKKERFKQLTAPHIKFLYNMACKYAGNEYDADDMVQETLYKAYKKFHQLRDESKCKHWLFTILRNNYLIELRLNRQRRNFEYNDSAAYIGFLETAGQHHTPETALEKKIESSQIRHILDRLPEKFKSPLLLYYMEEMSYREIASFLEIPTGTVMSRLSRAKRYCKKEMLKLKMSDKVSGNVIPFKPEHKSKAGNL